MGALGSLPVACESVHAALPRLSRSGWADKSGIWLGVFPTVNFFLPTTISAIILSRSGRSFVGACAAGMERRIAEQRY